MKLYHSLIVIVSLVSFISAQVPDSLPVKSTNVSQWEERDAPLRKALEPAAVIYRSLDGSEHELSGAVIDDRTFLPVHQLAEAMNAVYFWTNTTKKMVLRLGVNSIKLTAENRIVVINEKAFYIARPVKYREGTLFVPVFEFIALIRTIIPGGFTWDEDTRKIVLKDNIYNIINLEIEETGDDGAVHLYFSEEMAFEKSISEPNWLHLNIPDGKIDPRVKPPKTWGSIKDIKTYQFENSAQISFLFSPKVQKFDAEWDEKRRCLVVRFGQGVEKSADIIKNDAFGAFDCIVIDAGHGGKDPGAVGPTGLYEKEVVLDVAKRLAALIRRNTSMKVILTRDTDTFIPLRERTRMANSQNAKLFLSIHANASRNSKARGFQTFFLAQEKNDEARLVAAMENSVIKYEMDADDSEDMTNLDFIMWDMMQNESLKESEYLAVLLQQEMDKRLSINNRGVSQAGFYVLKGAHMPNVLVEIAFISNPLEEKLLRKRKFRQKIAESLYSSIKKFKQKYEAF